MDTSCQKGSSLGREAEEYQLVPLLQILVAVAAAICGVSCKTVPEVSYEKIVSPAQLNGTEFDTFTLQESTLVIDGNVEGGAKQLSVNSVPTEHDAFKIAIYRRGRIGVKTNVVISKIDNTEIPKEIGTELVDTRVEVIKQIGAALATVGTMALRDVPEGSLQLPKRIAISQLMASKSTTDKGPDGSSLPKIGSGPGRIETNEGIEIDIGKIPPDARPIDVLPMGVATSSFFFSACRTAKVVVPVCEKKPNGGCETTRIALPTVKISDPRYFQSVGLPQKGKVVLHSQCGVSVTTDKDSGVASNSEVIAALAAQVAAVKAVLDKDSGDGDKGDGK